MRRLLVVASHEPAGRLEEDPEGRVSLDRQAHAEGAICELKLRHALDRALDQSGWPSPGAVVLPPSPRTLLHEAPLPPQAVVVAVNMSASDAIGRPGAARAPPRPGGGRA